MNKSISFKQELSQHLNKWFHLIANGTQPHHVRQMMAELECTQSDVILDPFCGEGTTLIEAQLAGIKAYGFELNPFLNFVNNTTTNWDINLKSLDRQLDIVIGKYRDRAKNANLETLKQLNLSIPPINKPFSWWREDVLIDLLILKQTIEDSTTCDNARKLMSLALAAVLVPELSNTRIDEDLLFLTDRTDDKINVFESFSRKIAAMRKDLEQISGMGFTNCARCFLQDSMDLARSPLKDKISCIITNPPYPARYSYAWTTMPHLYFFGYHTKPQEPADLDEKSVGGIWGSATYKLVRGRVCAEHIAVEKHVTPIAETIRSRDNLAANHLIKYFNMIAEHLLAVENLPQKDLRIAYMLGSVEMAGIILETDQLLANIIEDMELGYRISNISNCGSYVESKPQLRQKIVYAWKNSV